MRYVVLSFALLCWGCQPAGVTAGGESKFVRQQVGNESVVVFVHGVTGDAISTWTNERTRAYWPRLIADDPAFSGEDIFVYEYPSPAIGQSYNINEISEDMRLALSDTVVSAHKRVIFLAHSMGGLIVRQYLLKYREVAAKVSFIYFYATPTTGSPMATLASLFSKNPQLGNLKPMKVDEYLGDLQRDWLDASTLRTIPSYCAYETRNTLTARIVEQESATNLCNQRLDPIDANHIDIVKPESMKDKRYQTFKSAYLESLNSNRLSAQPPPAQKSYRAPESMLLQQRDAAKHVFEEAMRRYGAGMSPVSETINANDKFLEAELSLSSGPDARIAAYEAALKRAKELERRAGVLVQLRVVHETDSSEATLSRTQIEIGLAAEQSRP